jgi:hypothetical protein
MGPGGLPQLGISSGPSGADGQSGAGGSSGTGPFNFKGSSSGQAGLLQTLAPFLIIGGLLWLMNK